jgi:hypothetical protein
MKVHPNRVDSSTTITSGQNNLYDGITTLSNKISERIFQNNSIARNTQCSCAGLQASQMQRQQNWVTTLNTNGFKQAITVRQATVHYRDGSNLTLLK